MTLLEFLQKEAAEYQALADAKGPSSEYWEGKAQTFSTIAFILKFPDLGQSIYGVTKMEG